MPFDALISVRYRVQGRLGQWVDKEAKSTMFPINWDITRVKQEIALVYDDLVNTGYNFRAKKHTHICKSTTGFYIKIEVDQFGNIIDAYPLM